MLLGWIKAIPDYRTPKTSRSDQPKLFRTLKGQLEELSWAEEAQLEHTERRQADPRGRDRSAQIMQICLGLSRRKDQFNANNCINGAANVLCEYCSWESQSQDDKLLWQWWKASRRDPRNRHGDNPRRQTGTNKGQLTVSCSNSGAWAEGTNWWQLYGS